MWHHYAERSNGGGFPAPKRLETTTASASYNMELFVQGDVTLSIDVDNQSPVLHCCPVVLFLTVVVPYC
ncbi:hypothetical protein TNCV_402091 [Trichonephila clavipes]|nr:hypothetical protein TNCV_402091 [Trichonephila clavipes]